jgi:hypothetical protein
VCFSAPKTLDPAIIRELATSTPIIIVLVILKLFIYLFKEEYFLKEKQRVF